MTVTLTAPLVGSGFVASPARMPGTPHQQHHDAHPLAIPLGLAPLLFAALLLRVDSLHRAALLHALDNLLRPGLPDAPADRP